MMKKRQRSGILICLVMVAMLLAGCSSNSSGGGSQTSIVEKTPTTAVVKTPTVVVKTPTVVVKTPTAPVATAQSQITPTPGGDKYATGGFTHFVGDLVTLDYPSYFGYKEVTVPGQPAGNHRFIYPMVPNGYIDVYEHDEDQDPGLMAAHTLSLTQAEMTQVATSSTSFHFVSAKGITWNGWDSTITLSHTYPGFGKYHVRIMICAKTGVEKLVIGIIVPESSYQINYQTLFLPIIQSLVLKSA